MKILKFSAAPQTIVKGFSNVCKRSANVKLGSNLTFGKLSSKPVPAANEKATLKERLMRASLMAVSTVIIIGSLAGFALGAGLWPVIIPAAVAFILTLCAPSVLIKYKFSEFKPKKKK